MKRKFKAGKYYIGDPCYVVNDEEWDDLLEQTSHFTNEEQSYKGHNIFAGAIAFGDGLYYDNMERSYGVDSGNLGIIPVVALNDLNIKLLHGHIITFKFDFNVEINEGIFRFGDIIDSTEEMNDCIFEQCYSDFRDNHYNHFYNSFHDNLFSSCYDSLYNRCCDNTYDDDFFLDDYFKNNFINAFNGYFDEFFYDIFLEFY